MFIEERTSTHIYRQKRMLSKDELEQRESLCVHEQPAYCVAACPLKLDTKAMVAAAAAGDFQKALQLYEKITPFPDILSAGCTAPCEARCKLLEVGEGISISRLEAAVCRFGIHAKARSGLRFQKKKSAAILGSGLFTLFLTGELAKKNYPVTVFCREPDLESFLRAAADFVPEESFQRDLQRLGRLNVNFRFETAFTEALLSGIRNDFDVVCGQPEVLKALLPELSADPALMYDRQAQIVTGTTGDVLDSAFGAKRAALTVDRLAQNLDPANSRGEEGPVETRLYTSLEGVEPSERIPITDEDSAVREARRCIQCRCEECIKGCAYLQHYQKFPRQLTREIYNNVSIIMGDHMMNKPINACSLCGQCTVLCPNGYDMADICHMARQNMVSTGKMPLAPHEFALMDMVFSNEEAFLCRNQPGYDSCRYVFFPGCQATAIAPATVRAAYLDLCARLEGGVALMLGCCGAICDWAGRYEMYGGTVGFLDRQLRNLGNPMVISGCPTCKKELSAHEGLEVHGIWEILEQIGLPEKTRKLSQPVAVHDSCGARGETDTQDSIRRIAEALGCQVIDTPYDRDKSPCCGYGGLTQYTNREVAREMTDKCLERSGLPYLSYCMACRDRFARQGRQSMHLLELVYGVSADECPDISRKRYNRLGLKNQLLGELWNEEVENMDLGYDIQYTKEAEAMMDDRMILKTDVIAVMEHLRATGEAISDADSGLLITRCRIGNVTFWIKYREISGGYQIVSAYSHRMKIVTRE